MPNQKLNGNQNNYFFTNGIKRQGLVPGVKVINIEKRPVEAAIAKQLKIPVLTLLFYLPAADDQSTAGDVGTTIGTGKITSLILSCKI